MSPTHFTHFVFVDFENVPLVDLGLVEGKPVHVTLLLGMNQTRLDLALVQQIRKLASQVDLVEVGASGHNALDLTLAYYLGKSAQIAPGAVFSIVSKDKDFEPMIAHLKGSEVNVKRSDTFAGALVPARKSSADGQVQKKATLPKATATTKLAVKPHVDKAPPTDERLEKLLNHLKANERLRPKKRDGLFALIKTNYGGKIEDDEVRAIFDLVVQRLGLQIDDKGKITYP